MAGDINRLKARAQGGTSGANAYDAAKNQMSSARAGALSSALGRANAINAPAAFNNYVQPRITGALDAGIGQAGALSAANNAFTGSIRGAANNYTSGIQNLMPLLQKQMQASGEYDPRGAGGQKALNSAIDSMLAPLTLQKKIANAQTEASPNIKKTLNSAITTGDLSKGSTGALARAVLSSNSSYLDAYNDLANIQTYLTTGKDPNGKTKAALKSIGIGKGTKDVDLQALQDLVNQYYGQQ